MARRSSRTTLDAAPAWIAPSSVRNSDWMRETSPSRIPTATKSVASPIRATREAPGSASGTNPR